MPLQNPWVPSRGPPAAVIRSRPRQRPPAQDPARDSTPARANNASIPPRCHPPGSVQHRCRARGVLRGDDGPEGDRARGRLREERLSAPELVDLEDASELRRQVHGGAVDIRRAALAWTTWPPCCSGGRIVALIVGPWFLEIFC